MSLNDNMQGILWMVATTFWATCIYAVVRHLSIDFNIFQIIFSYCLIALIISFPFFIKDISSIKTKQIKLHIGRSVFEFAGLFLQFYATTLLPLPTLTSLTFIGPLLTATLAVIILKEVTSIHSWIALVTGFIGVIIILRPDTTLNYGATLVILGCLAFSIAGIIIKKITYQDNPKTIVFYMLFLTTIISSPLALYHWKTPSLDQLPWLVLLGVFAFCVQFSVAQAISKAKFSIILPFYFTAMIFSSIIGYIFFSEIVTIWTIAGSIVILSSAIYATKLTTKLS